MLIPPAALEPLPVPGTPAIFVQGLAYAHPRGPGNIPALTGLSFSLEQGHLLCLAGVNGSGKSTLLCLLAGLYTCIEGKLEISGIEQDPHTRRMRSPFSTTALLLQDADMQILGGTVEEDLLLGQHEAESADERTAYAVRAGELARRFGLEDHLHSPPHVLSYGQKRKLCLACALLRNPRILLLDEPFSGLDYPAVKELRALLRECKASGMTLVVSTHNIDPVLEFTDRVLLLSPVLAARFGLPEDVLPHAAAMGVSPPLWRDFP